MIHINELQRMPYKGQLYSTLNQILETVISFDIATTVHFLDAK